MSKVYKLVLALVIGLVGIVIVAQQTVNGIPHQLITAANITINGTVCALGGSCTVSTASITSGTGINITSAVITNTGNTDINVLWDPSHPLKNDGTTDNSAALEALIAAHGSNAAYYVPCGEYNMGSGAELDATASTLENIKMYAAAPGCVDFNGTSGDVNWWRVTTASNNAEGPTIDGICFNSTGAAGAVHSGLRVTNYIKFKLIHPCFNHETGAYDSSGTITSVTGTAVVGSGSAFVAAMAGGLININGDLQQILSVTDSTHLTLATSWQYAAVSAGTAYTISWNGWGILLEGVSSLGDTQYGEIDDPIGFDFRVGIGTLPSTSSAQGTSRVNIDGGFLHCNRNIDSYAAFYGRFTDTMDSHFKSNNCMTFVGIESSHANKVDGWFENTGLFAPNSQCNGGVQTQNCTYGVRIVADATNLAQHNTILGAYFTSMGTAISIDSDTVEFTQDGFNTFSSITTNHAFVTGTGAGKTTANIDDSDMFQNPNGFSGTRTAGSCVTTYTGGMVTTISGCS